jgi:DUF1009 family protein
MCGAGVLPARMADEARRRGWRVVAFTFDEQVTAVEGAERIVACRVTEVGTALAALEAEGISAVLFSGRFSLPEVLRAGPGADALFRSFEARASSRSAPAFVDAIIGILGARGIEVLDQRAFLGDWLAASGCWSTRTPTEDEWRDARSGLRAARLIAQAWIGQTVVVRHGAVVAVEAVEGTTETVRRGAALAGRGAVVVKAVAPGHDYRFDAPAIGPETLAAAADGGVAVVGIEAGRVMLFDRAETLRIADAAGIAVIGLDGDA